MATNASRLVEAKALGAFYTPATIAGILAEWVVRSGSERLLEPSVGDGALISAALQRANDLLGTGHSLRFLACDVDAAAVVAVNSQLPDESEVRAIDFLQLDPSSTGKFAGVITNPPFTRNHALEPRRRAALRQRFEIAGAAGLWVHFLVHACSFLAPGGRLAAVVPASAAFTRYGQQAIARLCAQFDHVELRQIVDKPLWVNGADERGAILLASGYQHGRSLCPKMSRWYASGERQADVYTGSLACFHEALEGSIPLRDLACLSIGAVTGCNNVFLLNEDERMSALIGADEISTVVSRARQIPGLLVNQEELRALATKGEKTWLLTPPNIERARIGVRKRLSLIEKSKRRQTVWLNKRTPWWKIDRGDDCDAIFTYMNDRGPRLVLAGPGIACTNTLHRARFHQQITSEQRAAAALTMVSTFGQLAAELGGRSYGGGLLKFELGNARDLPVLQTQGAGVFADLQAADAAIRAGNSDGARDIADKVLLPGAVGPHWRTAAKEMAAELRRMRLDRTGRSAL